MKFFPCIILALVCVAPLSAQRYLLKDGKVLNQADVVLRDNKLVQSIGKAESGGAEISYALTDVVRLDWPEPAEIDAARKLLDSGKAAEAEVLVTPIVNQFAIFPKQPGSWFASAALVRARALAAQTKTDAAERAAKDIIAVSVDPDIVGLAQIVLAEQQIRRGKPVIADAMLSEILRRHSSDEAEARAALLRGDLALARKDYEAALGFYLQIPSFYGSLDSLMPAALLGSARAYRGYGDSNKTERAFLELMNTYPASAEAALAKRESGL